MFFLPSPRQPAIASLMLIFGACAPAAAADPAFTLSSPELANGRFEQRHLLNGFGCAGANLSPALEWRGVPAGTRSLVLMVHDDDAPTGSGFWHWAVYDIPASASGLPGGAGSGKLPAGARAGVNDFQDTGANGGNGHYGGPCPPAGDAPHRYVFSLYALAVDQIAPAARVPASGSPALYGFVLQRGLGAALLGKASFTATYGRDK